MYLLFLLPFDCYGAPIFSPPRSLLVSFSHSFATQEPGRLVDRRLPFAYSLSSRAGSPLLSQSGFRLPVPSYLLSTASPFRRRLASPIFAGRRTLVRTPEPVRHPGNKNKSNSSRVLKEDPSLSAFGDILSSDETLLLVLTAQFGARTTCVPPTPHQARFYSKISGDGVWTPATNRGRSPQKR